MNTLTLEETLRSKHVIICVGAGGVGKTTLSASLALRGAQLGRRSLVCTIDPAKRLANSLGIESLGNAESKIDQEFLRKAGLVTEAPLFAMMLDMKRSWDELVEKHLPQEKRDQVLKNRFYQSLSTALAGSQEYIAMEKLCQLHEKSDYELIVLDTPPTVHAMDFLDAPNRLSDFLDNDVARLVMSPAVAAGKIGFKLLHMGSSLVTKALANLAGASTMQELAGFLFSLSDLNEDLKKRAKQTRDMLTSPATGFVLVTSPDLGRLNETVQFHKVLQDNHMNVAAIVINRVHPRPKDTDWASLENLEPSLRRKLEVTLEELDVMGQEDERGITKLQELLPSTPLALIPRLSLDVHDLKSLGHINESLFQREHL